MTDPTDGQVVRATAPTLGDIRAAAADVVTGLEQVAAMRRKINQQHGVARAARAALRLRDAATQLGVVLDDVPAELARQAQQQGGVT